MIKPKAKCSNCGSENFFVHEFTYYKSTTDEKEKNVINCSPESEGINLIECAECGADNTEIAVTAGIQFNFKQI